MIDQPVALTTYHVLISKSHPHARTILYYVNSSLEKLREKGEYDRIIERHLDRFWEAQVTPSATMGTTPASGTGKRAGAGSRKQARRPLEPSRGVSDRRSKASPRVADRCGYSARAPPR